MYNRWIIKVANLISYVNVFVHYYFFKDKFKSILGVREEKFIFWVKKFVIGCLNRSCNGTIYFGVEDTEHGKVTGINISKNEAGKLQDILDQNFIGPSALQFMGTNLRELKTAVELCLKPVQLISITGGTEGEDLHVIEIDVESYWTNCQDLIFFAKINKSSSCEIFIRHGARTFLKEVKKIKFN
jgi:hypothetical protein